MIDNTPKRPRPTPAPTSALASAVATAITPMLMPSSATTMSPLVAWEIQPEGQQQDGDEIDRQEARVLIGVTFRVSRGDADGWRITESVITS